MHFNRQHCAAICLLLLQSSAKLLAADSLLPNFIIVSIDDLGYADIGPYGSKINRTPNLDRMAAEGRKLTSFYGAPVCSPSRASLLTGCYAKRVLPIPHVLFPGNAVGLSPAEITLAEVLKSKGYATGIVGKWHLGDQPEMLPLQQGFDEWVGLPYSNDMGPASDGIKSDLGKSLPKEQGQGQPPLPLMRNNSVVKRVLPDDQQSLVELYTDESVAFIKRHKDQPFFLYLPHNAVHFPLYPGKRWAGQSPHGLYSDWVEEVDWSVGEVLQTLREQKIADRTLVLFISDNGGTSLSDNRPLRGHKGSTWEGGMRVCSLAWWPGKIAPGTTSDAVTGMLDVLPTFAALAGAPLPTDRIIDGVNIWPILTGDNATQSPRKNFFYYRGLTLEAVRQGDWKLRIAGQNVQNKKSRPQLFDLKNDIGETTDVAALNPDVLATMTQLVTDMQNDLGLDGPSPRSRPLGRVAHAQPLIHHDGTFTTQATALPFNAYSGYFVSNQFQPDAEQSFLLIHDQAEFDKVFGAAVVMRDKAHRLPVHAFDAQIVAVAIERGDSLCTYKIQSVTKQDAVVSVRYSTEHGQSDTARYACPLIVSIPKGEYEAIQFINNGKMEKEILYEAR